MKTLTKIFSLTMPIGRIDSEQWNIRLVHNRQSRPEKPAQTRLHHNQRYSISTLSRTQFKNVVQRQQRNPLRLFLFRCRIAKFHQPNKALFEKRKSCPNIFQ